MNHPAHEENESFVQNLNAATKILRAREAARAADTEEELAVLTEEFRQRKARLLAQTPLSWRFSWLRLLLLGFSVGFPFFACLSDRLSPIFSLYLCILLNLVFATGLSARGSVCAKREWEEAARELDAFDPRLAGLLMESLNNVHDRVREAAILTLTDLLPRLTKEEAARITTGQKDVLHRQMRYLAPARYADFYCAVFEFLANAEQVEALPDVQGLAKGRSFTKTEQRVRRAASRCVERLLVCYERQMKAELQREADDSQVSAARTEAVEKHLAEFSEEKQNSPGMRYGFLMASWLIIVPFCGLNAFTAWSERNWSATLLYGLGAVIATQLHRVSLSPRQTEAAYKLARERDLRGVGTLAEALEWPDPECSHAAACALTTLLPRMKVGDAALLNARQRACLYRQLIKSPATRNELLILAILKALEPLADAAALPYVEKLVNSPALRVRHQICDAAADCLPFLQALARQQTASQTLLRASVETTSSPDSLLRPAASAPASDPQQLLRAPHQPIE